MSNYQQHAIKVRAAAYAAAADLGVIQAIIILEEIARRLKSDQWGESR